MQAMAALANSVRLSPQCLDALIGLGGILSDLNRPAEALPYLEAAARLDPDRSQLQMDLGFAYRQLDRDNEAEQAFAAAVRLAPQASDSHANLASLFVEQGRFDEALRCARTATKLSGNSRLHVLSATMMPVICDSVEAIETARHRFDGETREMLDAGIRMDPTSYPVPNHFYLAYHGLDDRALWPITASTTARSWSVPRLFQMVRVPTGLNMPAPRLETESEWVSHPNCSRRTPSGSSTEA
jgi:tetratricopeptide (TPR) repeat protein